jgi:hypothetical protein
MGMMSLLKETAIVNSPVDKNLWTGFTRLFMDNHENIL